jgi:hypothetical protein
VHADENFVSCRVLDGDRARRRFDSAFEEPTAVLRIRDRGWRTLSP